MDAQFKGLFKVTGKARNPKEKEAKKDADSEFLEALAAVPQELKDSAFVTAYVKRRIIQRTKRASAKEEREKARRAIARVTKATEGKKELVGAWRSKDFTYELWQLPDGKYYREITARPGLSLTN